MKIFTLILLIIGCFGYFTITINETKINIKPYISLFAIVLYCFMIFKH